MKKIKYGLSVFLIMMIMVVIIPVFSWGERSDFEHALGSQQEMLENEKINPEVVESEKGSKENNEEKSDEIKVMATSLSLVGSGTEDDPYLIQSCEDLNELRKAVNGGNGFLNQHFLLTVDLDFVDFDDDGNTTNGNFTPIGTSATPFQGHFNGGEHVISNITIKSSDDVAALFKYTRGATLEKFVLKNLTIYNKSYTHGYVGGLIYNGFGGIVREVGVVDAKIGSSSSYNAIGGLIYSSTTIRISDCYLQGSVIGKTVGELVYSLNGGEIRNSYTISSGKSKGLYVSSSYDATVENSYYNSSMSQSLSNNGLGLSTLEFEERIRSNSLEGISDNEVWKNHQEGNYTCYPTFVWEEGSCRSYEEDLNFAGGIGSESNPYLISTPEQWNYLAAQVQNGTRYWGVHFLVTDDLSFDKDVSYKTIGTINDFMGTLDGGQHSISIFEKGVSYLFQNLQGATLKNVVLNTSLSTYFIGNGKGSRIEQVGVTGIDGYPILNGYGLIMKDIYFKGYGNNYALLGYNLSQSSIENLYVASYISGGNFDFIYTGTENQLSNVYYDKSLGYSFKPSDATPLTTEQFIPARLNGFDFDSVWTLPDEQTQTAYYPIFKWERQFSGYQENSNYAGGIGSKGNPYLISTPEQLSYLSQRVSEGRTYWGTHFLLTNDLNFKNYDDDGNTTNGNFVPIGNSSYSFKGTFNGGEHTISNLTIKTTNRNAGLFGYTKGATIEKLSLDELIIENLGANTVTIGGVVSTMMSGKLQEVNIKNSVIGNNSSKNYVGGLVGILHGGMIKDAYAQGTVKGDNVGQLVYNSNYGQIREVYAAITINTNGTVGGINYSNTNTTLENAYYNRTLSKSSSSIGIGLSTLDFETKIRENQLVGLDGSRVWREHPSTEQTCYPIFAWEKSECEVYQEDSNYAGGIGSENDPYLISTPEQWNYLATQVQNGTHYWGAHFLITDDLSFDKDVSYKTIGTTSNDFMGTLDGGQHSVSIFEKSVSYLFQNLHGAVLKNVVFNTSFLNYFIGSGKGSQIEQVGVTGIESCPIYNGYDLIVKDIYIKGYGDGCGLLASNLERSSIESSYIASYVTNKDSSFIQTETGNQLSNVYYDKSLGYSFKTNRATPLTTEQFVPAQLKGFDFDSVWSLPDEQTQTVHYPVFKWEKQFSGYQEDSNFDGGIGSRENPYLISTPKQLSYLSQRVSEGRTYWGTHFLLTNHLNFKNYDDDGNTTNGNFVPIGNSSYAFKGTFDGGEHTISNLTIKTTNRYAGLFGYTKGATIRKVILSNLILSNVGDSSTTLGGVAASMLGGVIEEVGLKNAKIGDNRSKNNIGGLVGSVRGGTISDSYIQGSVMGVRVGQIAYSFEQSKLNNVYAAVKVQSSNSAKGLFYTSMNYNVENSYYDRTISGSSGDIGIGLETEEMMGGGAKDTMVGFNYDHVWRTDTSYPCFKWQPPTSTIQVIGMVQPTVIDITVPTAPLEFSLNPNTNPSFVSPELVLINESHVPLTVSLQEFEQIGDVMVDVSPATYTDEEWISLTKDKSREWALGLRKKGESEAIYVAKFNKPVSLGLLRKEASIQLELVSKHGLAFETGLSPLYRLVFIFELLP